jgi:ATP-dependent Lon protease
MKTALNKKLHTTIPEILPVIPTMDVVVFPQMIVPLLVLDEKIIQGINLAMQGSKMVMLLAAKTAVENQAAIGTSDLYSIGTVATIMRLIKIPEGGIKILVQGITKAVAAELITHDDGLNAHIEAIDFETDNQEHIIDAHIKNIKQLTEKMAANGHSFSPDFHIILSKMHDPEKIADFILSHLNLKVQEAQKLLECTHLSSFLEGIYQQLAKEIEAAEIQERVRNNARESMNRSQKEFYLREQLRAIKKELGDDDEEEIEEMYIKLEKLDVTAEVRTEIKRQVSRLERTSPDSMEAAVLRNYLEWVFALPWGAYTEDNLDITHAKSILDEDHYGLKDIKDRILDFISVRNLKSDGYAPILCFVGPPGTGKTSLGKSIARSLEKKYMRISLGGVRDEAEIRGHRRTYVGAMPGRFIQAMRKAESLNPVLVIDELDKIGADFRGDPSAAMLEVLDPQQNNAFYDNYLGLPFDLSKVMFIATANSVDTISAPLRDRMEIIELSGYTLPEKATIAKKHLITHAIRDTGLEKHDIAINNDVVEQIIQSYTRESGVRQLERTIRKLCSKMARTFVETSQIQPVTCNNLDSYLGPRHFLDDEVTRTPRVGIASGLAWTVFGGEMIRIEAVLMPGKGSLILTGQLGDVMKESAQAALSYARAHAKEFCINDNAFTNYDLHIHVPAGAVKKDGPSAGITMLTSILSALTNRPIDADYAMTGELNLSGDVMAIGGVKEKILAAKRNKIAHVILPLKNKNDILGIEDVTEDIDVIWVEHADEVLHRVLMPNVNA